MKHNIYVCKNDKLNTLLENYINDFIKFKGHKIIGIDFEFNRIKNKREIALCQINFEKQYVDHYKSDIFLFYPPYIKKNIFKQLLISETIKIIHGGESLDIPYLFDNILDNKEDRELFCINLYDTKYLCEYYNLKNNIDGKCKIYDLLLQMKVINKNKYNNLMENDSLMGNIWEINIDVKNMNKLLVNYCVYDVMFLPQLFRSFPKTKIYNTISNIACNVFNMRFNGELDKLFTDISKYNLEKYNEYNYNDIYIAIYYWLLTYEEFNDIYNIIYFKKYLELLIKNILYNKLFINNKQLSVFIKNIEQKINEML